MGAGCLVVLRFGSHPRLSQSHPYLLWPSVWRREGSALLPKWLPTPSRGAPLHHTLGIMEQNNCVKMPGTKPNPFISARAGWGVEDTKDTPPPIHSFKK